MTIRFLFLILSLGFFALPAAATITFLRASGYSVQDLSTATLPVFYGGFGENCDADCPTYTDSTTTRNTCRGTQGSRSLVPCNEVSVYSELPLTLYFQTNTTNIVNGRVRAFYGDTELDLYDFSPSGKMEPNTELFLSIRWEKLCSSLSASKLSTCEDGIDGKTIKVGVDTDSDGSLNESMTFKIEASHAKGLSTTYGSYTDCASGESNATHFCHFEIGPGDQKVYLENLIYGTNFPGAETGGGDWASIVLFYAKQLPEDGAEGATADMATLARITNKSKHVRVLLDESREPPISEHRIRDLENGSRYCFVMANQDDAGNVVFFTPSSVLQEAVSATKLCGTPKEVFGVLNGKKCFIATATFGSEMAEEVEVFRQFRDQVLLKTLLGRGFVKLYYRYSPGLATLISQSEVLKALSRSLLLTPLILAKVILGLMSYPGGSLIFVLLLGLILSEAIFLLGTLRRGDKKIPKGFWVLFLVGGFFKTDPTYALSKNKIKNESKIKNEYKVNEDGSYQYDVELKSEKHKSGTLRFGLMSAPRIQVEAGPSDFKQIYGSGPFPVVFYEAEFYQFLPSLWMVGGGGIFSSSGHGRFSDGTLAKEMITFLGVPFSAGLKWNLEYAERPLLMPQIGLGLSYILFLEQRDDNEDLLKDKYAGSPGAYGSVGLAVNVTRLDSKASFILDREYQIRNLWIGLEYRYLSTFRSDLDSSGGITTLGFMADYE